MEIIYILWLRPVKKFLRSPSRIIGSLGQPLLFLVAFGYGFGTVFQQAGQGSYIQFIAPGIILMSVLFTAVFSGIDLIWDKQFGFLRETLVAPASRFQIILGRTLGGATVASIQGLIVFLLTLLIGFHVNQWALFPVSVLIILIVGILFTSLGTAIATLLEDAQGFQLIINFLIMPIVFLSGAFFPLQDLPKGLEIVTRINPLSYAIDGLRRTLTSVSTFSYPTDLTVIIIVTAVLLALSSFLFSRMKD